jgi:translocation and assembly module TamB
MVMFRRILKWVLWITGIFLAVLLLVAAGLFFMPNMVSTDWFRQQFEIRASKSLHRSITVKDLQWGWTEGVRVKGIQIKGIQAADDPEYGKRPILSIDELRFSFDFELSPKSLFVDLEVDGLKANLIRHEDGRTNLAAWLTQLRPPQEAAENAEPVEPTHGTAAAKEPGTRFILPGDLKAEVKLTNAQLQVEDRMENRSLEIHGGTFNLDMPSLLSKPVNLNISSLQSMDGKVLPPLDLAVHVDRLVDETGKLNPRAATLKINGELPGLQVALKGSMVQKGLEGEVKIDLAPLAEAIQPFMPATVPELSGEVLFQTKAKLETEKMIVFDSVLVCENILASGGYLKEKKLGPFSATITQKGSAELPDKIVNLEGGEVRFMKKSGLSFEGRLKLEERNRVNVNLALNKITLHLDEIQALAKKFVPGGILWKGMNNAKNPDFRIAKAQLSGMLPDGAASLSVQDMVLNLSKLNLAYLEDNLKMDDLTLVVQNAVVQLKNRFPGTLEIRMNLGAKNIRGSGKHPFELDECRISSLDLTMKDLATSPEALWGMVGRITMEESGFLRGIRLPPHNDGTDRLTHRFKTHIELPSAPRVRMIFAEADLSAAPLKMSEILPRPLEEGLTFKARLKDVLMTRSKPLSLDVGHLTADIRSGEVLEFHVQGAASGSGIKSFRSEGRMGVDLNRVLNMVPAGLSPEGRFTGRVETSWDLQGRRPTDKEIAGLTDHASSLERRLQHAGFLEKLDLKTEFINMAVMLPLDSGEAISARGIHSSGPFKISTVNGLKSISILGELKVDQIKALPYFGKLKKPLTAGLSFNAVSRDHNSLELREALQLGPLGVSQTLELSLNKLNRLLRQKDKPDLSTLLKSLEARVKADINVNTGPNLVPFTRGLTLEGPLKGRLALRLRGGKSVSVKTTFESDGIDVAVPPKFKIDNLKTHLQLEKTYGLAFGPPVAADKKHAKALSLSVLQPKKSSRPKSLVENPLSQRLLDDLRGRFSRNPTLSFDSARLESKPFPFLVNNAQAQMRFSQSLPSIDYFQVDIMGGTLLGDLRIFRRHGRYHLKMGGDFSGLDADRLLQRGRAGKAGNKNITNEDTRISGRMSLQVPISADAKSVMGNLNAVFRLTHIGSRTLERVLYAMDPHENNERIVQQRALLKRGTPRWIKVVIRSGNLSLTGEVVVAGSNIRLPGIKRLNMASLPIQKQIQNLAGRLVPLIEGLKILSADTLRVEQGGAIYFSEDKK